MTYLPLHQPVQYFTYQFITLSYRVLFHEYCSKNPSNRNIHICVVIVRASARAQCGSGPIQTTFHIHTCHKFCSHFNSREVSVLGELLNIKLFLPPFALRTRRRSRDSTPTSPRRRTMAPRHVSRLVLYPSSKFKPFPIVSASNILIDASSRHGFTSRLIT